ncbi:MAG: MaoC family dehydratase [Porticoccaceae bacterium]|nr:MaoC family dehydratase [Porticoccaceae bacterium]
MTLKIDTSDLQSNVGKDCGTSDWFEIDQQRINDFADVTKDHQFIHVDPERAKDTPFGGTIAHGYLTMSLLAYFMQYGGVGVDVPNKTMGLNYGMDKLRFLQPVPSGSKVRANAKLVEATEKKPGQYLFKLEVTVEIEGEAKPALIAETLTMVFAG